MFNKVKEIIFDAILLYICLYSPVKFEPYLQECNDYPFKRWLYIQSIFHGCSIIRSFIIIFWANTANDDYTFQTSKSRLDVLYLLLVINSEVGWLIYGNTFQYSPAAYHCRDLNLPGRQMWSIVLFFLIMGYFIFAVYGIIVCVGCGLVCLMRFGREGRDM